MSPASTSSLSFRFVYLTACSASLLGSLTGMSHSTCLTENLGFIHYVVHSYFSLLGQLGQTRRYKQAKLIFLWFWRLEAHNHGAGMAHVSWVSLLGLQMATFSLCLHMTILRAHSSLGSFSAYKDTAILDQSPLWWPHLTFISSSKALSKYSHTGG